MKRRSFLVGLGGVSLGSVGILETGAFTTSTVENRGVKVGIKDDGDARLSINENHSLPEATAIYSSHTRGKTVLGFVDEPTDPTKDNPGGSGLNTDSVFKFDQVLRLGNKGTQPIYVWASFSGFDDVADMWMYQGKNRDDRLSENESVIKIGVGKELKVGFGIDTTNADSDVSDDLTMTVHAAATQPTGTTVVASSD